MGNFSESENKPDIFAPTLSNPEQLPSEISSYIDIVEDYSLGPQVEGLTSGEVAAAMEDERSKTLLVTQEDGEIVELPFLVPLQYAPWLNQDFFMKRGINTDRLFVSILPQLFLAEHQTETGLALQNLVEQEEGAEIVIDYPEHAETIVRGLSVPAEVNDLITEAGSPAATYHYETFVTPVGHDPEAIDTDSRVRKLDKDQVEQYFEEIWDIYTSQFQSLVDDHPVNGAIDKEQLYLSLVSESSKTFAFIDDDNELKGFGYLLSDLSICPWLNPKHFNSDPDTPLFYMPGIAAEVSTAGLKIGSKILEKIIRDNLAEVGSFKGTFECSNLSALYIPKILTRTLDSMPDVAYDGIAEVKHFYKVLKLGRLASQG
jgi:hypothetical protein